MSNFIKTLEIKNFKSIKHLQPLDCKRVNVIIGKPNVGKSNILEALGLFSINYTQDNKFLSEFVRYQSISNLFYDNDISQRIEVITDNYPLSLSYNELHKLFNIYLMQPPNKSREEYELEYIAMRDFDKLGYVVKKEYYEPTIDKIEFIKKYEFIGLLEFEKYSTDNILKPPHGNNLFHTLLAHKSLLDEIGKMLKPYGQEFVLDMENQTFETQKKVGYFSYKYPYLSVADTFRRLIFHLAAIESNKDAVILFEEPESHSYPPYIWQLANRIAQDVDNQYFITTHSPYMLETLMQELGDDDLNIWITYFENYETKVHPLSKNELQEMYDLGGDIFFNMDKFEKSKAV